MEPVKKTLTFTLEKTATAETKVKLVFDERHVDEYNFDHATEYVVFPEKLCTIANDGVMTIPAGETSAQIAECFRSGVCYHLHGSPSGRSPDGGYRRQR